MEERHPVEETGRTVEEAVDRALAALGLEREAVQVDVLDEGSRGVLGLGAREARVRVTPTPPRGRLAVVTAVGTELLTRMGVPTTLSVEDSPESVRVAVEGDNLAALIGKHGQTLAALEALVALIAGRRLGGPVRVELDVMGYRERRRTTLETLATRTAERVARTGREVALAPMEARDRRIVHVALQDSPTVSTASRGEGEFRRVVVMPKSRAGEPGASGEIQPQQTLAERQRDSQISDPGPMGKAAAAGPGKRPDRPRNSSQSSRRGSNPRVGRYQDRAPADNRGRGLVRKPPTATPRNSRPEGLPVDEELEAEIEAHLERMRRKASERAPQAGGDSGGEPDESGSGKEE